LAERCSYRRQTKR